MMTRDNHTSQSHNRPITITPDNYISETISQVGGFCALSGVFILTLPIPIVVNRFLKIDLTYIAMMPVISQHAWRWCWDAKIWFKTYFQFCDVLQEPFVENRGEQNCVFRCASISWIGYDCRGVNFSWDIGSISNKTYGHTDRTILLIYNLTTLKPHNLTTLQLYNFTTLQLYNLATLQPYNFTTSQLYKLYKFTTLQPYK